LLEVDDEVEAVDVGVVAAVVALELVVTVVTAVDPSALLATAAY